MEHRVWGCPNGHLGSVNFTTEIYVETSLAYFVAKKVSCLALDIFAKKTHNPNSEKKPV